MMSEVTLTLHKDDVEIVITSLNRLRGRFNKNRELYGRITYVRDNILKMLNEQSLTIERE